MSKKSLKKPKVSLKKEGFLILSKVVNQHTELEHTPKNLYQKAIFSPEISFIIGGSDPRPDFCEPTFFRPPFLKGGTTRGAPLKGDENELTMVIDHLRPSWDDPPSIS